MTSTRVCLSAAVCSLIILTIFTGSTQSASCCLMYCKHRLSCQQILDYSIQTITGSCDIEAIIFHLPGRFLCAKPSMKWTQRGMKCVDARRKMSAQTTGRHANTTTSA